MHKEESREDYVGGHEWWFLQGQLICLPPPSLVFWGWLNTLSSSPPQHPRRTPTIALARRLCHRFVPPDPKQLEASQDHLLACMWWPQHNAWHRWSIPQYMLNVSRNWFGSLKKVNKRESLKTKFGSFLGRTSVFGVGACALFSMWWGAGRWGSRKVVEQESSWAELLFKKSTLTQEWRRTDLNRENQNLSRRWGGLHRAPWAFSKVVWIWPRVKTWGWGREAQEDLHGHTSMHVHP